MIPIQPSGQCRREWSYPKDGLVPEPTATPHRPGRERYLDVLRGIALVRVVAYHTFGFAWFAYLFPSMGVMFALAGSLMAGSVDRSGGRRAVTGRLRRLLPPLWLLGLVLVPLMLLHGWTHDDQQPFHAYQLVFWLVPLDDPAGSSWGLQITEVLWYLRAYLWFVLLSGPALLVFRRWPLPAVLAPVALIVLIDTGVLAVSGRGGDILVDLCTYGACWLLGFARRDGLLHRLRWPVVVALAAAAMAAGAAWAFTHPDQGYDLNNIPTAQAFWSIGAVLVLMRLSPRLAWLDRVPPLRRAVAVLNGRAVTIYLWHEAALMLSVPVNDWLGWYTVPEQFLTTWLLIGLAVLLLGWVEDVAARRRPTLLPGSPRGRHRTPPAPPPADHPADATVELPASVRK
jgi:peptidoglycan/LPS O-acetylase OafA/YrhL